MGGDLVVRTVADGDLAVVAQIYAHYVEHTVVTFDLTAPGPDAWRRRRSDLAAEGWPFLVGVIEGHVIGYGQVAPWRSKPAYRHTVESSIYLDHEHTGRGHGPVLLDRLLSAAADNGARQVVAMVAVSGADASLRLHQAAGFRAVGRLRDVGYKHGRWIDVDVLQRPLRAPLTGLPGRPAGPGCTAR